MERWTAGLAGAAAATIAGALALRRGLRTLDAADVERAIDVDTTFPPGLRAEVTTSDGATIATESTGEADGPAVVLVHGITSSRHDWGPVARTLVQQGHLVVGVDQRGHGGSVAGSQGYSFARLGRDLAEVFTDLDLRDVILVGHSMGGIAAMTFALDHPDIAEARVAAMVLVATTSRTPGLFRRPPTRLVELTLGQANRDVAIRRPAVARALFGRFGSSGLIGAALASARRARPREVAECAVGLVGYDIAARLSEITIPTQCIYGTQDIVTSARANRLIARTIPGATVVEIPGAGHLLIWTHVPEITDQVTTAGRL